MADTRFLSFDEAMELLNVSEDELHDLVAANELRAFRVDREMKFKEEDVQLLSGSAGGESNSEVLSLDDADVVMVDEAEVGESASGALEEVELLDMDEGLPEIEATPILADVDGDGTIVLDEAELQVEELGAVEEVAAGDVTELAIEASGESTEPILEAPGTDGLGTEEIIFEDEDLAIGSLDDDAIGTQEITVQEAAIGAEDLTIREDTEMGATVSLDEEDEPVRAPAASARISARRSGRSASVRRTIQVQKTKGNPIMTGLLAVTALAMLYPFMLYVNVAWQGFATGMDIIPSGYQDNEIYVKEIGPLFIHKFFRGFLDADIGGAKPVAWWGMPSREASSAVGTGVVQEEDAPEEEAGVAPADADAAPAADAAGEAAGEAAAPADDTDVDW